MPTVTHNLITVRKRRKHNLAEAQIVREMVAKGLLKVEGEPGRGGKVVATPRGKALTERVQKSKARKSGLKQWLSTLWR